MPDNRSSRVGPTASDAPRRHSTFRRRARFAAPVVLIVSLASACGAEDKQVVNTPSAPTTATTVVIIANPPTPDNYNGAPVTTAVTVAPAGPVVISNPPPPADYDPGITSTVPADGVSVVISNPPPPSS